MFFKSIRFKVLVSYMLLLTLTLLIFSAALYGVFDRFLMGNLDDLISSRAEGVADSIDAYWTSLEGAKGVAIEPGPENLKSFEAVAREWVEEKRKDPELMKVFVRILNTKGEQFVSTRSMPALSCSETISAVASRRTPSSPSSGISFPSH